MQNILTLIQNQMTLLFSQIKNKQTTEQLKNAFGAELSGKNVSDEEYLVVRSRIQKFKKDRMRLQTDSTKIVIERHVADNIFKKLGSHVFIQQTSNKRFGHLYNINTKSDIRSKLHQDNSLTLLLIAIGFIISILGMMKGIILAISLLIAYIIIASIIVIRLKKKRKAWGEKQGVPQTLDKLVNIGREEDRIFGNLNLCVPQVILGSNGDDTYRKWHTEVLQTALAYAGDNEARLGWLCSLKTSYVLINPLDKYTWDEATQYFLVKLYCQKDNMIPVVITNTAYVFFFPDHPDTTTFVDESQDWEVEITKLFKTEQAKIAL